MTLYGDLVLLCSGLILGIKIVYTKHAVRTVEPGKLIYWHDVFGTLLFLAYSFSFESTRVGGFTTPAIIGLLYQGILVGGLCFAIQALQLKQYSASQIAVFSASTPLFGILFGWLLRGDPLSGWLLAAAAGVAWGILLVTRKSIFPGRRQRA
ncbi:MAG: DMT family transporter [Planctomycetota bacterium]|nr:DMT family transporter [Planctomycetota bacterium]